MLEVHDEPYKESYTVQVNTDNIALYIWIEAIGIQVTYYVDMKIDRYLYYRTSLNSTGCFK